MTNPLLNNTEPNQHEQLDRQIDKMLMWNIMGHIEPFIFQPEVKKAIRQLIAGHDAQLYEALAKGSRSVIQEHMTGSDVFDAVPLDHIKTVIGVAMNQPQDTKGSEEHEHIFRNGVDTIGSYIACECGHKKYDANTTTEADVKQNPTSLNIDGKDVKGRTEADELRNKITAIKCRLAGRIETHRKVAKLSFWTTQELEQVIQEDGWIFEDEMLALINSQVQAICEEVKLNAQLDILQSVYSPGTPEWTHASVERNRLRLNDLLAIRKGEKE